VRSLTATIKPSSRSARHVLADVAAAMRQLAHVNGSDDEFLTELPGVGPLLTTHKPGELILDIALAADADPLNAREAVRERVWRAAGSRAAAARLVITWTPATTQPSARPRVA
jgi:hypothetical protein